MACNGCEHKISTFSSAFWGNEEALVELLIQHGVLLRSVICQRCGNESRIRKWTRGWYFYCGHRENKNACRYKKSARVNTFLGDSILSIQKTMFFCLYWLLLPGPRHKAIMEELQCGNSTVVDWSTFNRVVCVNWMLHNRRQIGGNNKIVEIDESKFGRRKSKAERHTEGQGMLGGVERADNTRFFLVPMVQRTRETLLQIISDWILPGTIIISDCWKAYNILDDETFLDLQVNHSIEFVSTGESGYMHMENLRKMGRLEMSEHLNAFELRQKTVKYSIPRFVKKKVDFEGYLAEYIFKCVHSKKTRMHHFLNAAAALYPPPR